MFVGRVYPQDEKPARLGEFILCNLEPILHEWENFARSIWPGEPAELVVLRNDAALMLQAVAQDIGTSQTKAEQQAKSEGGDGGGINAPLNQSALSHAISRVESGFDIIKLVAEFRALRAAVNRLWAASSPVADDEQIEDMLRFNEAVDQLVAASVAGFSERVERSRRLFLGILGHDLRQPLQSMQMLAELLGRTELAPSKIGPIREKMKLATSAMTGLLADLLDFNGGQLGTGMPVRRTSANLEAICRDVVSEFSSAHPSKEIQLVSTGSLEGEWDAGRLRQLISNLLSNAIQYGTEGPVHLSLQDSGDRVVIEVQNWGPPVPEEAFATLFNPLVRLNRPDTERPHGSLGLGLYICREIAIAHGGTIHVNSSSALGTIFTIDLPKYPLSESSS